MFIKIDPTNGLPIYLQILNQVKTAIALGRLQPEEALPSVRQLAMDLAVNPNTVARAYLDLEHEGVIYKRAGQGTFVSRQGVEMSKRERLKLFHDFLERALVEGVHLGLEPMEMKNSFDQQLERIVLSRQGQKERGR